MTNIRKILWIVLAALSFAYGGVVALAGTGTLTFALWIVIGIIFVLFAVGAKKEWWSRMHKALKIVFLVIVIAVIASFGVFCGFVASQYNAKGPDNLDYIVVLGAQVKGGNMSTVLSYRIDAAVDYLKANPDTKVIVSGGQGANEDFTEAQVMAAYLQKSDIDYKRIILEDKSQTTTENLQFSKALIEKDATVGIVTNNFHVYRALQNARAQGYSHPQGIAADSAPLFTLNNVLREYLAEIKFLITN